MAKLNELKLNGKLEQILDLVSDNIRFIDIAKKMQVSTRTLNDFVSRPENNIQYREALQRSADGYADKAEEILMSAPRDKMEIYRARELAQHYRWMASKRKPQTYGDKIDVTTTGERITSVSIEIVKPLNED
jgi:chromatin remodeling complex protein RSC6